MQITTATLGAASDAEHHRRRRREAAGTSEEGGQYFLRGRQADGRTRSLCRTVARACENEAGMQELMRVTVSELDVAGDVGEIRPREER